MTGINRLAPPGRLIDCPEIEFTSRAAFTGVAGDTIASTLAPTTPG
jgi:hypothetical protein